MVIKCGIWDPVFLRLPPFFETQLPVVNIGINLGRVEVE